MLTNVRSDRVRSLRTLSRRVARDRAGRFLVEGPQAVREAVALHAQRLRTGAPAVVHELVVEPDAALRYADLVERARAVGVLVTEASAEVLGALSDTVHPQGLVAVCAQVDRPLSTVLGDRAPSAYGSPLLIAVLAQIRDPGNAGTVVRAADAAGGDAVIFTEGSVDVHNAKCVRASAGSLFHLPIATGRSLPDIVTSLHEAGCTVLAADGRSDATDLDVLLDAADRGDGPLRGPVAWIFGNEAWGLRDDDLALADRVVRVPIHGSAESLNLATAAAICLYASARARRA